MFAICLEKYTKTKLYMLKKKIKKKIIVLQKNIKNQLYFQCKMYTCHVKQYCNLCIFVYKWKMEIKISKYKFTITFKQNLP